MSDNSSMDQLRLALTQLAISRWEQLHSEAVLQSLYQKLQQQGMEESQIQDLLRDLMQDNSLFEYLFERQAILITLKRHGQREKIELFPGATVGDLRQALSNMGYASTSQDYTLELNNSGVSLTGLPDWTPLKNLIHRNDVVTLHQGSEVPPRLVPDPERLIQIQRLQASIDSLEFQLARARQQLAQLQEKS